MDYIYCMKCKDKTDSVNMTEAMSKNNRRMIKAQCADCGTRKCKFIKNGQGLAPLGQSP